MTKRTWHEDARKRLVGARIAVGGDLHLLEMALKDYDTLRAQLARAEKCVDRYKTALVKIADGRNFPSPLQVIAAAALCDEGEKSK